MGWGGGLSLQHLSAKTLGVRYMTEGGDFGVSDDFTYHPKMPRGP